MIPAWASIDFSFDQEKVKTELLNSNAFEKLKVATSDYTSSGYSIWDPNGQFFNEEIFEKQKLIPHYKVDPITGQRSLIKGEMNTFQMLNLTHVKDEDLSLNDAWKGEIKDKSRKPLWILHQDPWLWRNDLELPYTQKIIQSLPFEYFLTVRCIIQKAPSIGVVHKDNSYQSNQDFYKAGFGSITLNICSGDANLFFINHLNNKKYQIDESRYQCWHFDDSHLHCTTEVKDLRIQIRVFGKLNVNYDSLFVDQLD